MTHPEMMYSDQLEFEAAGMPVVNLRRLSVHHARKNTRGNRMRNDIYLEVPGVLHERRTGRSRPHTLRVFLGMLEGRKSRFTPDPGLRAWMERRGTVKRRSWLDLESLRWDLRRLTRWDHDGAAREALAAIRETTTREME